MAKTLFILIFALSVVHPVGRGLPVQIQTGGWHGSSCSQCQNSLKLRFALFLQALDWAAAFNPAPKSCAVGLGGVIPAVADTRHCFPRMSSRLRGKPTDILAIDCEMVRTEKSANALARVSIINYNNQVVYDTFVTPLGGAVLDYRTKYSGVTRHSLQGAPSFREVQREVFVIIQNRTVVGHDLSHDFNALRIAHPERLTRDTAKYPPLMKGDRCEKPRSLRSLANNELGMEDFRAGSKGHDSVADAAVALGLYKANQKAWEGYEQIYARALKMQKKKR